MLFRSIVVNDASIDNTVQILKKYREIKIINNEKNFGLGFNRNKAISHSKNEIIASIDSDVVLEKNRDLVMIESWHSDKHPTGSNGEKMNGRYFGYPVNKTTNELLVSGSSFTEEEARVIHNDPAYAPYTPPYFEGTAIARISFTPTQTKKYELNEIFSNLTIEDIFTDASLGWAAGSDAEIHKMKIGSSIELFDSALSKIGRAHV